MNDIDRHLGYPIYSASAHQSVTFRNRVRMPDVILYLEQSLEIHDIWKCFLCKACT